MTSERVQKCIGFCFGCQCMYQSKRSAMQPLDNQCARAFLGDSQENSIKNGDLPLGLSTFSTILEVAFKTIQNKVP